MKKLGPLASHLLVEAVEGVKPEQLEEISHPLDAVQLLFEQIPTAALKVAREEIKHERRQPIPAAVRQAVWKRDHGRCVLCRRKSSLHAHHFVPVSEGGKNTTGNLVLLCANDHMAVHAGVVKISKPRSVLIRKGKKNA